MVPEHAVYDMKVGGGGEGGDTPWSHGSRGDLPPLFTQQDDDIFSNRQTSNLGGDKEEKNCSKKFKNKKKIFVFWN